MTESQVINVIFIFALCISVLEHVLAKTVAVSLNMPAWVVGSGMGRLVRFSILLYITSAVYGFYVPAIIVALVLLIPLITIIAALYYAAIYPRERGGILNVLRTKTWR